MWAEAVKVGLEQHAKGDLKAIQYGTAGFRTDAKLLDHVMYRMGILAVLRSKLKQAAIGVMITASHNQEKDNGVKLVDPKGEMLEQSWEALATKLANAKDDELDIVLDEIAQSQGIDHALPSSVFVGRDTRESSPRLAQAILDGIKAVEGAVIDAGIVSTPQLHYLVVCQNTHGQYGEASAKGYYSKISQAFKAFRGSNPVNGRYSPKLMFDGANGVGAQKMKEFLTFLGDSIQMEIVNDGTQPGDVLNGDCGADFVKVQQTSPKGLEKTRGERCVSVDGDADRVMYFYNDKESGQFAMLDGDRIATLVAEFLKELLDQAKVSLNMGIVQTAYANGSSTNYITQKLNVPVACVPTGVKHLHHKAQDFDIGVYFEANGHGTIVFSDAAQAKIRDTAASSNSIQAQKLAHLVDVINQTVGDAISDMLLVESILHAKGWSIEDWRKAYQDLPNRQMKVRVADRNVISTTDAERQVVTPKGLQDEIDALVKKFPQGRSFVRPSGTEDVVRVYSESDTQDNADQLAYEVGLKVHALAGGVGEPTPKPK
ncbi:phosphoacetylglucosamine mutase-like [Tigriopus californicus]|uniref:phosphoacetylglucosamine mutase-like n=1 Tax=Tigriopus californicus TaxID=6832 RepID=UPI0027DA27A3|nr:phosphoacetylglucosamine mutase-like [Tigriopus californicus]XP_059083055.1 phosphoacetylglucosamine mutase-like [Tigriopus californicus]